VAGSTPTLRVTDGKESLVTNKVTEEYLAEFREQDARTNADFARYYNEMNTWPPSQVVHNIEAEGIRDFDTYITHSGAQLLSKEQFDLLVEAAIAHRVTEEGTTWDDWAMYFDTYEEASEEYEKQKRLDALLRSLGIEHAYMMDQNGELPR
jgi:hypothetical protein